MMAPSAATPIAAIMGLRPPMVGAAFCREGPPSVSAASAVGTTATHDVDVIVSTPPPACELVIVTGTGL